MTITHAWALNGPALGEVTTGVIRKIPWRLTASDGVNSVYESGTVTLADADLTEVSFADVGQVTDTQLIDWVKAALGEIAVAQWEADASAALAAKLAPQLVPLLEPSETEASGLIMMPAALAIEAAMPRATGVKTIA